jgi:serine/threonine-protein kinase PpkA
MTYEMLTGKKPYHAVTAQALLDMHINNPVPLLPAALAQLQPVLQRMMAKQREARYGSAQELLDDLGRLGF